MGRESREAVGLLRLAMVLLVLAIFATSSFGLRTVVQWGQQTLRAPESFVRRGGSRNPIDLPDFAYMPELQSKDIEKVISGTLGEFMFLTQGDHQIYLSGIMSEQSLAFQTAYDVARLRLEGTLQTSQMSVVSVGGLFYGSAPAFLNPVLVLAYNSSSSEYILYQLPNSATMIDWSDYPWYKGPPGAIIEGLECNNFICLFLQDNIPYVFGTQIGMSGATLDPSSPIYGTTVYTPTAPRQSDGSAWNETLLASSITIGRNHILALSNSSNSTIVAWGDSDFQQTGCSSSTTYCVFEAPFEIAQLAAGAYHSLVLTKTGEVHGFGQCTYGQLGYQELGSSTYRAPFVAVDSLPGPASLIGAVMHASFAYLEDGRLFAWGGNSIKPDSFFPAGMLGINRFQNVFYVPEEVPAFSALASNPLGITRILSISGPSTCVDYLTYNPSCLVNMIVEVSSTPAVPSVPLAAPPTVQPSFGLENSTVISWGAIIGDFTGNTTMAFRNNKAYQRATTVSIPRNGRYAESMTYQGYGAAIQEDSSSLWVWGSNVQSGVPRTVLPHNLSAGVSDYIFEPYNTKSSNVGLTGADVLHYAISSDSPASVMATTDDIIMGGSAHGRKLVIGATGSDWKQLSAGFTHFAAVFHNGSLYTWHESLSSSATYLGHSLEEGFVDLENVQHVGTGFGFTIVHYINQSQSVLVSFGENIYGTLGIGYWGSSFTEPQLVNVSDTDQYPLDVEKIACGNYHTVVLLRSGAVIGWGRCDLGSLGPLCSNSFSPQPQVVSHPHSLLGLNAIDVSAVGDATFMLNSDGQVFALGGTAFSGGHPVGLPYNKLIYKSAEPVLLDINEIDGVRYKVTKLMKPAPFFTYSYSTISYTVIATPVGNAIARPLKSKLHSWGDNSENMNYGPTLGLETSSPLQSTPKPMWPLIDQDSLPFDMGDAKIEFWTQGGFALAANHDLYAWGNLPVNKEEVYYQSHASLTFLTPNISSITTFEGGIVFVADNGTLGCMAAYNLRGACTGSLSQSWIHFPQPSNDTTITRFVCNSIICAGLTANPEIDDTVYIFGYQFPPSFGPSFLTTPPFLIQNYSIVDMLMLGGKAGFSPNSLDIFHYIVRNGITGDLEFAVGNDSSPFPVSTGVDANAVTQWVAGAYHILALRSGEMIGWGLNGYKQLTTDEMTMSYSTPVPIHKPFFSLLAPIRHLGAMGFASMALLNDGQLYTWGYSGIQLKEILAPNPTLGPSVNTTGPILIATNPYFTKLYSSNTLAYQGGNLRRQDEAIDEQGSIILFTGFLLVSPPPSSSPTASPTTTANPPATVPSSSTNPPSSASGCLGSVVSNTAVVYCRQSPDGSFHWVIQGNLTTSSDNPVEIDGDVEIEGDLTVDGAGSLIVRLRTGEGRIQVPSLNVSGCANIRSPITISASSEQVKQMQKDDKQSSSPQRIVESSCAQDESRLNDVVETKSPKGCRKLSSETSQTSSGSRSTLNVLFKVNGKSCNTWWIVLVSVLGGVIVLGLIFTIIYLSSSKLQQAIRPFKGTN